MKIEITFDDGESREYTVSADIAAKIQDGFPFWIKSIHPKGGEVFSINVLDQSEVKR